MEVDYKAMPEKARQIQSAGMSLNKQLKSAWNSVNELRSTWYGRRYNELISLFNKVTQNANEILQLVIVKIPYSLGTIAVNYSRVEGISISPVEQGSIDAIETLADSDESTLGYQEGPASTVKSNVETNINSAETEMENIIGIFNTIYWQSDSRDNYAARLNELKSEIDSALDAIKSQFSSLMEQASQDMAAVEKANDVNQ